MTLPVYVSLCNLLYVFKLFAIGVILTINFHIAYVQYNDILLFTCISYIIYADSILFYIFNGSIYISILIVHCPFSRVWIYNIIPQCIPYNVYQYICSCFTCVRNNYQQTTQYSTMNYLIIKNCYLLTL